MPLDEEDYRYLVEDGLDGLTVYQETYDEKDIWTGTSFWKRRETLNIVWIHLRGATGIRTIGIGLCLDWEN